MDSGKRMEMQHVSFDCVECQRNHSSITIAIIKTVQGWIVTLLTLSDRTERIKI